MNPRYKISTKWTPFPVEFSIQIKALFTQNFAQYLGQNIDVFVEGRIYQKEVLLRVGLHHKGEIRRFNFEVSLDLNLEQEKQVFEQISLGVDAIATLMTEYFENEQDIELPFAWTETTFGKDKVWIQHSSTNSDLEAQANQLLGLNDDGLMKNSEDLKSDDILDATEDEFDEFATEFKKEINKSDETIENTDILSPDKSPSQTSKKKKDDLH